MATQAEDETDIFGTPITPADLSAMPTAADPGGNDAAWAQALTVAQDAATALADVDLSVMSAAALGEDLLRLRTIIRQLESTVAHAGARFADSGEWSADGARSAHAWLHGRGNDGVIAARTLVERGRFAQSFPSLAAAWRAGAVSGMHLDVLRRLFRKHPRLQDSLLALDEAITVAARACEPAEFHQRLREICHRADPDAVDDADREQRRQTYLHASTFLDGFVHVTGVLDPVLGAHFMSVLESARRDVNSTTDPDPGKPFRDDMGQRPIDDIAETYRPLGQVNLDALRRILDAACSATGDLALPLITGERPIINVTIALESLTSGDATAMGWLERFGLPAATISAALTRQLSCDASLRPLIVDRSGQLVSMAPRVRSIHPALRRAVFMRDVRCRFPGCRGRIDEVHHIVFHSRGGPTVLGNLIGLCWFHHHAVHDDGWSISGRPDGPLEFRSPTGRRATSDPPV